MRLRQEKSGTACGPPVQCTPVNCGSSWFNFTYQYNLAGGLTSESNPMGFALTQSFDSAARLVNLTSSWSDAQHPPTLMFVDGTAGYTPAGALQKFTYGNGLVELNTYNNRLQPTHMRTYDPNNDYTDVLNLSYGFIDSAGHNNGNVMQFTSTATQLFMRSYTYDQLNRLATMSSPADASGCYGLSWTYDAWANRLGQTVTSGACLSGGHPAGTTNRISDTGFGYDVAGNMTSGPDPNSLGTLYYAFDAENRMTSVSGSNAGTYSYDAGGNRVRRVSGGITTDYVYDASGSVVAEWSGGAWSKGYVYSGAGQLVAQYNGALGATGATTLFVHKDHLGSTRVMTTYSQTQYQIVQVSDSMDYLPFGELLSGGSSTTHEFTGKERDPESGLDDFGARYNSSSTGRFMSPDGPLVDQDPTEPQSWNLYTYVRNNPLTFTDPDGTTCIGAGNQPTKDKTPGDCKNSNGTWIPPQQFTITVTATPPPGNSFDNNQFAKDVFSLAGNISGPAVSPMNILKFYAVSFGGGMILVDSGVIGGGATALKSLLGGVKVTFQDLLNSATKIGKGEFEWVKPGGFGQATRDFEALEGEAHTVGNIRFKDLPNGQGRAVLRNFSRD